jgi:hypothetical protein
MPVENLAIVEGPMSGLGTNGTTEGELFVRTKKFLLENDVRPWWMLGGAGIGALLGESRGKGAVIGAALGSGMSILASRTCRAEAPWTLGVAPAGIGQIQPSGIEGVGQIQPSGIEGLGAVEMTRANMIGLAAAGLLGAYLVFGRG